MMISDEALASVGEALDSRHFRAALQERLAVIEAVSVDTKEKIGVHVSGFTLAVCAGMVNAVAFAGFKNYVSHVSGSSTAIGLRSYGVQDPPDVATPALLVLDFIIGSTLCGLIVPKATLKIGKAPYSSALILLALVMAMPIFLPQDEYGLLGAHLLALGCGLQNGLCSSWSGNVIRTTHMTGTGTDLGLAMGRIISRFLSKRRNFAPEDWEEHTADRNKVILMTLLLTDSSAARSWAPSCTLVFPSSSTRSSFLRASTAASPSLTPSLSDLRGRRSTSRWHWRRSSSGS
jgi:uncharacterized membrane protein YoaK (UPF0700 family)